MRFIFIAANKAEHTVSILCRCLHVTRSGFYAWHVMQVPPKSGDPQLVGVELQIRDWLSVIEAKRARNFSEVGAGDPTQTGDLLIGEISTLEVGN